MEKKYYIPKINEFHIGFEFEVNYGAGIGWVKDSLYSNTEVIVLPFIKTENIRVKYLDREDIESLGFKYTELFGYRLNDYCLIHWPNDVLNENTYEICLFTSPKTTIFYGRIKNKSELRKLLEMLNIKYECIQSR